MVRNRVIALILVYLQLVFATPRGSGDGGTVVTLTTTSGTTVTIPANGTATQSSIQPAVTSSVPLISIPPLPNATTCMPIMFTWQVTPSTINMTNADVRLTIVNDGVERPASQPSASISLPSTGREPDSLDNIITRCVTNNTALSSGFYNWTAVTVPAGWYKLDLCTTSDSSNSLRGISAHSERFFVMAGSNTSCVHSNMSTPAQANSRFTSGALAGTVAGSVVGAAALLGAFLLPRLWRKGVPGHKAWQEKHGLYKLF